MKKIKVIKGTPIYTYRSTRSLDPIPNLIVKEMIYNEDENITYVRLKRKTIWIEFLCSIIIICCVILSISNYNNTSIKCNYNSLVNYYDNKLFLNWQNPLENTVDITFELVNGKDVIYKITLAPGESKTYIDLESVEPKYTCTMSTNVFNKTVTENVTLTVINRELK